MPIDDDAARVIVTGSEGYLGSTVVEQLTEIDEYTVLGADRRAGRPVDVRDEGALYQLTEEADAVIHLAAIPGVVDCRENPAPALRDNLEATSTVIRVCHDRNLRLIFASSQAARTAETLYGWTKQVGVNACHKLDLDWVALEFANIYGGEGKGTVVERLIRRAKRGEVLPIHRPGTQERNFVHRSDAARACVLALRGGANIVPIGGKETWTITRLADEIARRSESDTELVHADRPTGPEKVSVEMALAEEMGYQPQKSLTDYLDAELGEPA